MEKESNVRDDNEFESRTQAIRGVISDLRTATMAVLSENDIVVSPDIIEGLNSTDTFWDTHVALLSQLELEYPESNIASSIFDQAETEAEISRQKREAIVRKLIKKSALKSMPGFSQSENILEAYDREVEARGL